MLCKHFGHAPDPETKHFEHFRPVTAEVPLPLTPEIM
jgi:hypothetical protein